MFVLCSKTCQIIHCLCRMFKTSCIHLCLNCFGFVDSLSTSTSHYWHIIHWLIPVNRTPETFTWPTWRKVVFLLPNMICWSSQWIKRSFLTLNDITDRWFCDIWWWQLTEVMDTAHMLLDSLNMQKVVWNRSVEPHFSSDNHKLLQVRQVHQRNNRRWSKCSRWIHMRDRNVCWSTICSEW